MLNRNTQPALGKVKELNVSKPQKYRLVNNIPVYIIEAGDQDIIRLDIIFQAGSRYQQQIFQAGFANSMLMEGTTSKTAHQIAEEIDYYGSYVYPLSNRDEAYIQIYSLGKFLPATLTLVKDILHNPEFSEKELESLKNRRAQSLAIDNKKVEYTAKKHFFKTLFGPSHAYGRIGEVEHIPHVTRESLIDFHQNYYHPDNCEILISGKKASQYIPVIEENMGVWKSSKKKGAIYPVEKEPAVASKKVMEDVPGAVQAAIRMGGIMPTRNHEDFSALNITNTILGGYFGSRLMQNIREDKGYTYGVGSSLFSFKEKGVFLISTDVGLEYYKQTLKECYYELERLSRDLVKDQELQRVRQYIQGELLRQLDGPYNQAESFKTLLSHGMDFSFLKTYLEVLNNITPSEIRKISRDYLTPSSFIEVVAGVSPD